MPLGKLGYHLPRTISNARSRDEEEPEPFRIREQLQSGAQVIRQGRRNRTKSRDSNDAPPRPVFRIGGSVIGAQAINSIEHSGISTPRTKDEPSSALRSQGLNYPSEGSSSEISHTNGTSTSPTQEAESQQISVNLSR